MKVKNFIKNYNIASPDWNKIPTGYPYCDTSELNHQEKIIWDAAKIAWINEHLIDYIGQIIANGTIASIVLILISTVLISLLYYADVNYHLGLSFLTNLFA
jgi:hypothetical protein